MKWFIKITGVHAGVVQGEAYNDAEKGKEGWAFTDWTFDSTGPNPTLMPSRGTFESIGAHPSLWYLVEETALKAAKLASHGVTLLVGQGTCGAQRVDVDKLIPRVEQMLYEMSHGYVSKDSDLDLARAPVLELLKPRDHGRGPGGA